MKNLKEYWMQEGSPSIINMKTALGASLVSFIDHAEHYVTLTDFTNWAVSDDKLDERITEIGKHTGDGGVGREYLEAAMVALVYFRGMRPVERLSSLAILEGFVVPQKEV